MNRKPDEPQQPNGGSDPGAGRAPVGDHLSDESLNSFVDRGVPGVESSTIETHLESCAVCSRSLVELQATRELLRALPSPVPARSFQLGPEHLRSRSTLWDRLGSWLLPALPALRTATVAVALLLAAVSIRNVLDDPGSNAPVGESAMIAQHAQTVPPVETANDQNTAALETNQNEIAPPAETTSLPYAATDQPSITKQAAEEPADDLAPAPELAESDDDAPLAGESASESEPVTESDSTMSGASQPSSSEELDGEAASDTDAFAADEAGDDAVTDDTAMRVDEGADAAGNSAPPGDAESSMAMVVQPTQPASPPASPSPEPTATATPSPTPTATVTPIATPQTASEAIRDATSESDRWGFWNVAQVVLAILLVLLLILIGVISLRRRRQVS